MKLLRYVHVVAPDSVPDLSDFSYLLERHGGLRHLLVPLGLQVQEVRNTFFTASPLQDLSN
jgi:hypothetical protein